MAKSDLLVLHEMAEKNLDIRSTTAIVSANLAKGGGHVTMGVDAQVIHDLAFNDKHIAVLYIIDKGQFFEIKNQ